MTRKTKPPVPLYSALADATRCRIIEILVAGPVPVHRLADAFPVSRPAISRHLRVLKTAGLVAEVKKGRENLYTLKAEKLAKAITWIEALTPAAITQAADQMVPIPAVKKATKANTTAPKAIAFQTEAAPPVARAKPERKINQMGFDF